MKRYKPGMLAQKVLGALCVVLSLGFTQIALGTEVQRIFIAGDSTAASYGKPDQEGWGAALQAYLDESKWIVENRARGGRSSRTFITEEHWQSLLDSLSEGDVVLIQFGHNDAGKINDPKRARGSLPGLGENSVTIDNLQTGKPETVYSFGHYLRRMIADVRARKATPVLLNLTARNIWQGPRIERGSGQFGAWSYQIAWQENTAFIDVTNSVADQLEQLGPEAVAALYPKDHTHFNPQGADLHARTVVAHMKGLRKLPAEFAWSARGEAIDAASWSWLRLPFPEDRRRPSVFLVGDSTVRNGAGDGQNGEWGWGDFLEEAIDKPQVQVVNRAVGGLSSRTFYTGGWWQRSLAMMQPGDTVVLQFGHNDAAAINDEQRARGTLKGTGEQSVAILNGVTGERERVHTYGWYLRQMVGEAQSRGIQPVICSPVPRKIWDGRFIERKENSYPDWARQVAREAGVPFIDLHMLISREYEKLGRKKVDALFADKHTHTSKAGAELNAAMVAEQLSL